MKPWTHLVPLAGLVFMAGCGNSSPTSTGTKTTATTPNVKRDTTPEPRPEPKSEPKVTPKDLPGDSEGPGGPGRKLLEPLSPGGPGNATKIAGPKGAGDEVIK